MKNGVSGRLSRALPAALAAVFVCTNTSAAQDRWRQQVVDQLDRAANITGNSGYTSTHETWIQSLRAGENKTWRIRLEEGVQYRIVGACDNDCRDLDLKLLGGETVLAQDVATDDVPVIAFTPSVSREYTLQAIMVNCSVNPCRYGVGVYGRRPGAASPASSASSSSSDRWEQQVINQLNAAANVSGNSGYVQTHGPWLASLRQGERTSWTVRLNGGATYRVMGVCDNDCRDLDLKLYSGDSVLAQDLAVDDVPILSFTPATTREYRLEVIMATCSVNPCRYGVAVYGR